ncbi:MAG: TIGR03936 family radical SAM-associated protein [Anaerolineae bacterium]|nr:TIGR03936 family radical SAM-associated protein [Anaerolineae bacterium]
MGDDDRGITRLVEPESQTLQPAQRMRITLAKGGAARFISHLDVTRALERAFNRAALPLAYSQGFNRRPRLSLAAALPLGYTSEAEIADVWLVESLAPQNFLEQLSPMMPPGITVVSAAEVPLAAPSLQQQLAESIYVVRFMNQIDPAELEARVGSMMAAGSLIYERVRAKAKRPQPIDLRPLILDMRVDSREEGAPVLHLRLVHTATQTGKPDDVLAAMGIDPLDTYIHRTALRLV